MVYRIVVGDSSSALLQLGAVLLGCAVYFAYDLVVTAASLAVEDGCSINSLLTWASIPMGLATFVSINTLGFLASLLWMSRTIPHWTLLLLAVPIGTILVAVRSVSEKSLAEQRLRGLLETATHAPDWTDEEHIERSLLIQAERTLRQATASFRDHPPVPPEIGVPIEVPGRPVRHLVVTSQVSSHGFDEHDKAALEALTAVAVSAFNRRRLSDEMTYLARHDALTGLHNRAIFTDRLTQALERRAPRGQVAVLYIDLDGFKEVNDVLGHEAGDALLALVAERINQCLRLGDTAARLGGDEFGILLDDLTDESQADQVGERLLEALSVPFEIAHRQVRVQGSIGIAFSGTEASSAEKLINSADTAMYAAKSSGQGSRGAVPPRDARGRAHPPGARGRAARGRRHRPDPAALPARRGARDRRDRGLRGPRPLDPPDARLRAARRLHRRGGAHRHHPHPRAADPRARAPGRAASSPGPRAARCRSA